MAKKFIFNGLAAYQEGPFAVVKKVDIDGLWYVYHIASGLKSMGKIRGYEQKRDALTLAQMYCNSTINWDFKTESEMYSVNSEDVLVPQINQILRKGVP